MIFPTYISLKKSNTGKVFKALSLSSSNSFLFSPIQTFFSQVNPCLIAFKLDRFLPTKDLGPVDFLELSLLALIFLSDDIFSSFGLASLIFKITFVDAISTMCASHWRNQLYLSEQDLRSRTIIFSNNTYNTISQTLRSIP